MNDRFEDETPEPEYYTWMGKNVEEMTREELLAAFKELGEAYRQATCAWYTDAVRLADSLKRGRP